MGIFAEPTKNESTETIELTKTETETIETIKPTETIKPIEIIETTETIETTEKGFVVFNRITGKYELLEYEDITENVEVDFEIYNYYGKPVPGEAYIYRYTYKGEVDFKHVICLEYYPASKKACFGYPDCQGYELAIFSKWNNNLFKII